MPWNSPNNQSLQKLAILILNSLTHEYYIIMPIMNFWKNLAVMALVLVYWKKPQHFLKSPQHIYCQCFGDFENQLTWFPWEYRKG